MSANVQDTFVLFGDSLTQGAWEPGLTGFGERLSHVYARKLDIVNRGFSGYTTEWAMPVFEQCFAKSSDKNAPKVKILTIWFGANDSCIKPSPQHVPLSLFISNLRKMIHMIQSPESQYHSPSTRIILMTPPPVNTFQRRADLESRKPPLAMDRLFDNTKTYASAVRDIAAEKNLGLVDVWTALWKAVDENEQALEQVLVDGLHLNDKGYQIVYDALINTISDVYPEVHYDKLEYVFPLWDKINFESPAESLYIKK